MICVPHKNLFTGIHNKKCENYTELTKKKNQKQIFLCEENEWNRLRCRPDEFRIKVTSLLTITPSETIYSAWD